LLRRIAAVVTAAAIIAPVATANAADRPFTLRYSNNVNGQIITAANTLMQCPTNTVDPLMNSGCTGARAGTNARNNNSFDMQLLDQDSDASTFDSSSATLALPNAGHVMFAGLYWTGLDKKGEAISGANGFKAVPLNPPDATAIGAAKIQLPGSSGYTTVNASRVDTAAISNGGGYTAFADVTELVSAAGAGTYTVANVQTGTGGNSFAGWSLVVAYSDPAEPLRNLSVFDGLKVVSGTSSVDIPLSGFKTPSSGMVKTTLGVVAAEGDAGMTGDYLTLNDKVLTDAVHPSNNTENSTIANRGTLVTSKAPNWLNQLGYDSSLFNVDGFLANGATTAMFRAKTSGDTYAPQAITFATELFSPNVTLTKTSTTSQDAPGGTKTYTITATNNGTGDATGVLFNDVIPAGVTYAPLSLQITSTDPAIRMDSNGAYDATTNTITARLGADASSSGGGTIAAGKSVTITFAVTINPDQPLGNVITNGATLAFVSADLGLPISVVADNDTTVAYPDPGVVKSIAGQVGNTYTFHVDVTNQGTLPVTAPIQLTDTLAAGAGSISAGGSGGWSCAGTPLVCTNPVSGGLAAGASLPPLVVTATWSPGQPVTNRAVLTTGTGGEPGNAASPAILNNTSAVDAGQTASSNLTINKASLDGTVSVGESADFRMLVRNDGPSASTGTTFVDTLPAGLVYDTATATQGSCSAAPGASGTTTVTCALGSIAANATATVTVRARPDMSLLGTTVTNTATVDSDTAVAPATDTADLVVRPGADLSIKKAADATDVAQGSGITYTLTATNNGPGIATDVQIADILPDAIDLTSVQITPNGSGTCSRSGSAVTCIWTGSTLNAESRSVVIGANTKASWAGLDATDRNAVNVGKTFSLTDDPDRSNNTDAATVIVTDAADLQVTAAGPAEITAGGTSTVTFTTVNNGPSTAAGSTLTITIPAGLAPISAPAGCTIAGQTVTCALGDVANGATITTPIGVQAAPNVVSIESLATATVSSTTADHQPQNNADVAPFVLGPVADLTVTKTAQSPTATAGGTANYVITVANNGPATSNGASLTDVLPAGLTPLSISSSTPDTCAISGQAVTCQAGEIVPNAGFQLLVVAQVDQGWAGASITNTATLTPGAETDPNAANNTSSATITVNPGSTAADLKVTKKASAKTVKPGGTLGYTITVANQGGSAATSATLTDTLPVGLTPTSATFNGTKCTISGRKVTCALGQMITGASTTVKISAKVGKDRAGETLVNTATASTGSQTDSNPANNSGTATSKVSTSAATQAQLGITTRVGPGAVSPGQSVLVSSTVRTLSDYPANTVRICISIPKGLTYKSSSGTRRGSTVCWTKAQIRKGTPATVSYRATARSIGTVTALGTAVAGNAAKVSALATLPIYPVTG
jgi:fimbrial isopeptide formation D2 family protein/uncharacterized repeat protein (TIGR01451 family)